MADLPRIKLCGLGTPGDVSLALAAGADGLGFVHHRPSPRHLEPPAIRRLVLAAGGRATTVLVVVDHDPRDLATLVDATGVDAVQLCGAEDPKAFRGFPVPILRRLPVAPGGDAEYARFGEVAAGFVLDAPSGPGGTGQPVDADLAARFARRAPCLLAGGLDAHSVSHAVARVRPHGVDASSGLERGRGRKDAARLTDFALSARLALGLAPHSHAG